MTRIRIGTRGSELALWQATEVSKKLRTVGYHPEIVTVRTTGDKRTDVSLASLGGKALFIKELEEALDRREIDIAVHSLKDVPSIIPQRFVLAGFLERADPRDAWVHPNRMAIKDLARGARIGTSSPRRRAQLIERFPHLKIEPIRGNVSTRIDKMRAGSYDGLVLASAGLERLGRAHEVTSYFSVDELVPAAGQGIVVVEILATHAVACDAAAAFNHPPSERVARCERGVLQQFGAQIDCYSAIAVHATVRENAIDIRAFAADGEATCSVRVRHSGIDEQQVIAAVYHDLIDRGAMALVTPALAGRSEE